MKRGNAFSWIWTGKGANIRDLFCTTPKVLKLHRACFGIYKKYWAKKVPEGATSQPQGWRVLAEHSMQFQKNSYTRARSILEMHRNERGRVCPRTLVDQKRKCLINVVDVVERLLVPIDQVPNVRHLGVQHTFSPMTSRELTI